MLVELNAVAQRYQAVPEVLNDGASVTDVARRHGSPGRPCTSGCALTRSTGWAGWLMHEVPRVREAIADAKRQHRSAQAYASRSIDDAWTQLSSGAALSVDQRVDLILSRVEAFRMAQDVTAAMVRLVGTQAIYSTSILDRLVRDAITINQHVAAGPLMLDAAGRLALGLELQGFVAAIV